MKWKALLNEMIIMTLACDAFAWIINSKGKYGVRFYDFKPNCVFVESLFHSLKQIMPMQLYSYSDGESNKKSIVYLIIK